MSMTTKVELSKSGARTVYHERRSPPDPRRPTETWDKVTHAWTHADDAATREACEACQRGVVPKEVL